MKIKQIFALGSAGCVCFAAAAQQDQTFQAPVVQPATVGAPLILNLTGVTVTDQAGQPIGPIQHVLLSPAGCLDMAVLSLGGQKLVPVPWQFVGGTGAARAETEVVGRTTLALNVDRVLLQQAPSVPVTQLSLLTQPPMVEQVRAFYVQHQQQPGTATGGTSSHTGVNVGVGVNTTNNIGINTTNRIGIGLTNAAAGLTNAARGLTNAVAAGNLTNRVSITNQTGILSPTGPSNAIPGRPAFETNRPGFTPPGAPQTRPPLNRPPTTRPPTNAPPAAGIPGGTSGPVPNHPGQP